jgi:plasmid stabilization system protein ParE
VPPLAFTPAAQANLVEIANYIESARASVDAVERFIDRLLTKCESWRRFRDAWGVSDRSSFPDCAAPL